MYATNFSNKFHNFKIHQKALISWKLLPKRNGPTFHNTTSFTSSEACKEVVNHLLLHLEDTLYTEEYRSVFNVTIVHVTVGFQSWVYVVFMGNSYWKQFPVIQQKLLSLVFFQMLCLILVIIISFYTKQYLWSLTFFVFVLIFEAVAEKMPNIRKTLFVACCRCSWYWWQWQKLECIVYTLTVVAAVC